jgi:hypothetical protein
VNAFFCKWLDSWVIRNAASRMPGPTGCNPQLRAAQTLISAEDFFSAPVEPAKLEFLRSERFQFPSPIQTPFVHNNVGRRSFCCTVGTMNSIIAFAFRALRAITIGPGSIVR